jgi:hypothetical protein
MYMFVQVQWYLSCIDLCQHVEPNAHFLHFDVLFAKQFVCVGYSTPAHVKCVKYFSCSHHHTACTRVSQESWNGEEEEERGSRMGR